MFTENEYLIYGMSRVFIQCLQVKNWASEFIYKEFNPFTFTTPLDDRPGSNRTVIIDGISSSEYHRHVFGTWVTDQAMSATEPDKSLVTCLNGVAAYEKHYIGYSLGIFSIENKLRKKSGIIKKLITIYAHKNPSKKNLFNFSSKFV